MIGKTFVRASRCKRSHSIIFDKVFFFFKSFSYISREVFSFKVFFNIYYCVCTRAWCMYVGMCALAITRLEDNSREWVLSFRLYNGVQGGQAWAASPWSVSHLTGQFSLTELSWLHPFLSNVELKPHLKNEIKMGLKIFEALTPPIII